MRTSTTATVSVPAVPTLPSPALPSSSLPSTETGTLALILFLAFFLWASRTLRLAREKLPALGLIPRVAGGLQLFTRAAAIVLVVQLLLRLLPESVSPAVPWMIVAAAAAVGWSSRDLLPDVIAGVVLNVERKVRPGDWISSEGIAGTVQAIGFRASAIRDSRGQLLTVPNRFLIGRTMSADASPWPEIEVIFAVPAGVAPRDAERAIREAALMLPWIAPHPVAVVRSEGGYRLRARVLEGRFIDVFSTAVRDRVDEALRQPPV